MIYLSLTFSRLWCNLVTLLWHMYQSYSKCITVAAHIFLCLCFSSPLPCNYALSFIGAYDLIDTVSILQFAPWFSICLLVLHSSAVVRIIGEHATMLIHSSHYNALENTWHLNDRFAVLTWITWLRCSHQTSSLYSHYIPLSHSVTC